jgi:hypothetical protein
MAERATRMKSIWYLVGLMLLTMGAVVTVAGIVDYLRPPATSTVLAELHPGFWWGLLMLAAGAAFFFGSRRTRGEHEDR